MMRLPEDKSTTAATTGKQMLRPYNKMATRHLMIVVCLPAKPSTLLISYPSAMTGVVCGHFTSRAPHLEQSLHDGILSDHGDPHAARRVHDFHALRGFSGLCEHLLRHFVDFFLESIATIVHLARRRGSNQARFLCDLF